MRERILFTFIELSIHKGFYKVTMDELAAKAGISKRTIYTYFNSKEELIQSVINNFLNDIQKEIDNILLADLSPDEIFEHILQVFYRLVKNLLSSAVMEDLRQHYPQHWKRIDTFRMELAGKVLKKVIEGSKKEKDCLIISTAYIASMQAVLNPEFLLANEMTYDYAVEKLAKFFKHGLMGSSDKNN